MNREGITMYRFGKWNSRKRRGMGYSEFSSWCILFFVLMSLIEIFCFNLHSGTNKGDTASGLLDNLCTSNAA